MNVFERINRKINCYAFLTKKPEVVIFKRSNQKKHANFSILVESKRANNAICLGNRLSLVL